MGASDFRRVLSSFQKALETPKRPFFKDQVVKNIHKKRVDGRPASRKQVTFESTSKSAKKSHGKNSVRIGVNLVSKGIHTPCLRCDISQDLDQPKAFSEKTVNEALSKVSDTKSQSWNSILNSSIYYWTV